MEYIGVVQVYFNQIKVVVATGPQAGPGGCTCAKCILSHVYISLNRRPQTFIIGLGFRVKGLGVY
jgi:hypothetical protein